MTTIATKAKEMVRVPVRSGFGLHSAGAGPELLDACRLSMAGAGFQRINRIGAIYTLSPSILPEMLSCFSERRS
jgi:hypothetical protein